MHPRPLPVGRSVKRQNHRPLGVRHKFPHSTHRHPPRPHPSCPHPGDKLGKLTLLTPPASACRPHPRSQTAKVEQALEAHKVSEARRQAWDALAEHHGAPLVARGRFEARVRTWCRQTIDDYPGGVMGAVDTWERAEDDEGTTALFAPFGEHLDEEGRDAVCAMLRAYPAHADSLWEAALMASVR